MERMTEADQAILLLSLQRDMTEMKRRTKEVVQKNEQEMQAFRRENEEMKKKLMEGGSSIGLTNVVGRPFTSLPNPRPTEDTRDKIPTHEMDGESFLNKSARTTITMDSPCRHPFTNTIVEVPLPDKWKGFNRDRYMGLPTRMSIWMPTPPI